MRTLQAALALALLLTVTIGVEAPISLGSEIELALIQISGKNITLIQPVRVVHRRDTLLVRVRAVAPHDSERRVFLRITHLPEGVELLKEDRVLLIAKSGEMEEFSFEMRVSPNASYHDEKIIELRVEDYLMREGDVVWENRRRLEIAFLVEPYFLDKVLIKISSWGKVGIGAVVLATLSVLSTFLYSVMRLEGEERFDVMFSGLCGYLVFLLIMIRGTDEIGWLLPVIATLLGLSVFSGVYLMASNEVWRGGEDDNGRGGGSQ